MLGEKTAKKAKFKKQSHLRKADEISSVFDFKCRVASPHFVILGKPNNLACSRLAVMVPKRTNKLAVRRNYMRRLLREYFRKNVENLGSLDLVIRVTRTYKSSDFEEVIAEISHTLNKLSKCREF